METTQNDLHLSAQSRMEKLGIDKMDVEATKFNLHVKTRMYPRV